MRRASRPERTRSRPNRYLERGDVHLAVQSLGDLGFALSLEEQLERFLQVRPGLFDRVALAGNINLGTKRYETSSFAFDDCG
jgi:hypothetical protein